MFLLFRGSSAVERPPVKRLVVGSNPTRGVFKDLAPTLGGFIFLIPRERVNCFTRVRIRKGSPVSLTQFLGEGWETCTAPVRREIPTRGASKLIREIPTRGARCVKWAKGFDFVQYSDMTSQIHFVSWWCPDLGTFD